MSGVWPVAGREYLERVRSKSFLVGTLLAPLLLAGIMIAPGIVASRGARTLSVAVLDAGGGELERALEAVLANRQPATERRFTLVPSTMGDVEERRDALRAAVLSGQLDGFLWLPPDAVRGSAGDYYGRNVADVVSLEALNSAVEQAVVQRRLALAGVDPSLAIDLTRPFHLRRIRLSPEGEQEDRGASFVLTIVLVMMIYGTVVTWGQATLTSVIEEKTSRVVEIIVSAMPAHELLAGKLLGVGAVGLTQCLAWVGSVAVFSLWGGGLAAAMGVVALPRISLPVLVAFVIYFLLGYLLYASLFAAVGASVNSVQEAQSLVLPIFMVLVVGVVFFPTVMQSPDSTFSTVVSLVPLLTPLLMFLRLAILPPPVWQVVLSIVLTGLTIALVLFAAGRIYRVGVLMYGKRPTLPEILRWIRTP
jgi:ABC-2 type transport system permease protein